MQRNIPILSVVIPCYNEEEVLNITKEKIEEILNKLIENKKINGNSKVIFVDDGSIDKTWEIIRKFHEENNMFIGIKLSHNRGHQNALLAGLMEAQEMSDIAISMDADLQDDPNVIDKMIEEYMNGSEIVYGVRSSRKKDSFFKKFTAEMFYKFMHMMGVEIIFNHADYRLMSSKALKALSEYKEVNLFLRGIVPLLGYKYSIVYYERNERAAGKSKYPLKKMLSFATNGITSFSIKPLRFISFIGFLILIVSIIVLIYALVMKSIGNVVAGWTFIVCSIWLIGGIETLCLGVIGEYIGKIYSETKARPRYTIEEKLK